MEQISIIFEIFVLVNVQNETEIISVARIQPEITQLRHHVTKMCHDDKQIAPAGAKIIFRKSLEIS